MNCSSPRVRCKNGAASWNWRVVFTTTVPSPSFILYLQLWDFDLLKYNDCLAETVLDLSEACKKCGPLHLSWPRQPMWLY